MQSPRPITFFEKLGIASVLFRALGHVFIKAIVGVFKRQRPPFKRYLLYSFMRFASSKNSVRQTQYTCGTTLGIYQAFCKATGNEAKTVEIGNGCQGLWLGDPDAKNVFVYYHGGGFIIAADIQHFYFLQDLLRDANAAGADLAIFVPTYDLANDECVYPTQIRQCVQGLEHILKTGRAPANIVIGGDSAGAQASLAVLSHISGHPHPSIESVNLRDGQDLKAVIGLSPWVSYREDFTSSKSKVELDFLNSSFLTQWSKVYKGTAPTDEYNEPLVADAEWWGGVRTEKLLIVAGQDEILIDSVDELVAKMKVSIPEKITYVSVPGMAHDGPIFDRIVGETDIGDAGRAMVNLLKESFAEK